MSGPFHELVTIFSRLPGIGSRQARRIVEHLVRQEFGTSDKLVRHLTELKRSVVECSTCRRLFEIHAQKDSCSICLDTHRNESQLMVVEKDIDLETIEKSGGYEGKYFVLGGLLTLTEKDPSQKIKFAKLRERVQKMSPEGEVILALSTTQDGEETALYLEEHLAPLVLEKKASLTRLGRGLSTGAELEYADPVTIKNALTNRK